MITINDLTARVEFGKGTKATTAVNASNFLLVLQQLSTEKSIGDELTEGDYDELPKVEIQFFSEKSVDVLIKALQVIKKNFNPPPEMNYALAC